MPDLHKIAYEYLPNFKGDPVVLFTGDQEALEALAHFLGSLVKGSTKVTLMLDTEPLFASKRGIRLTLTLADSELGMRRVGAVSSEPRFEWRISRDIAVRFARLTRAVANSIQPSHQYLDADGEDEVTVVVSKGEYDEALLQRK